MRGRPGRDVLFAGPPDGLLMATTLTDSDSVTVSLNQVNRLLVSVKGADVQVWFNGSLVSSVQTDVAAAGSVTFFDVDQDSGAATVNQYLRAGMIDEIELHVVPMLIGAGERLFVNLGDERPRLELIRTVAAQDVTHLKYRVVK